MKTLSIGQVFPFILENAFFYLKILTCAPLYRATESYQITTLKVNQFTCIGVTNVQLKSSLGGPHHREFLSYSIGDAQ